MGDIKGCPFCGSKVRIGFSGYYQKVMILHAQGKGLCVFDRLVTGHDDVDKVLEIWNRRVDDEKGFE